MICLSLYQQISIHCLYAIAVTKMMMSQYVHSGCSHLHCARAVEDKQSYSCVFVWLLMPLAWGRLAQ